MKNPNKTNQKTYTRDEVVKLLSDFGAQVDNSYRKYTTDNAQSDYIIDEFIEKNLADNQ